jgi:hypothetical protein
MIWLFRSTRRNEKRSKRKAKALVRVASTELPEELGGENGWLHKESLKTEQEEAHELMEPTN